MTQLVVGRSVYVFALILSLSIPVWAQPQRPQEPVEGRFVRFHLRVAEEGQNAAELSGTILLYRADGGDTDAEALKTTVERSTAGLHLPVGSVWSVQTEIPGTWSPGGVVTVSPDLEDPYLLELRPLGRITGGLEIETEQPGVDAGAELRALRIRFRTGPRSGLRPMEGTSLCPVETEEDDRQIYTCEVPSGTWDVALNANGFVPHYLWDVRVAPGSTIEQPLVLKPGASLSGFVEADDGVLEPGDGEARLVPRVSGHAGEAEVSRLLDTAASTRLRKRGFFLFEGVAAGRYTLEIEHPGFAVTRMSSVEVLPRSETHLTVPLLLRRPLTMRVTIEPRLDWLGRPWRVSVARQSELTGFFDTRAVYAGTGGLDGEITIPEQSPGTYQAILQDSLGNLMLTDRSLVISGPHDAHKFLEVEVIRLEGEVLLGEEPISATLWFGGRHGVRSIRLESDLEGHFEGVLPKVGSWKVEVNATEPEIEAELRVEVRADAQGAARTVLHLPDTELYGRVTNAEGRPVAGARVSLETTLQNPVDLSDEDGSFVFRAFDEGPAALSARLDVRLSAPAFVPVQEGIPAGPVTLRLEDFEVEPFAGRVVSETGAVAGAKILVDIAHPIMPFSITAFSGLDGRFEVEVPKRAELVQLTVLPPNLALKAFLVDPRSRTRPDLLVTGVGGTLAVELPDRQSIQALIIQDGKVLGIQALGEWTLGNGGALSSKTSFAFPKMSPGNYKVCLSQRLAMVEAAARGESWRDVREQCDSGFLNPGGVLELSLVEKE